MLTVLYDGTTLFERKVLVQQFRNVGDGVGEPRERCVSFSLPPAYEACDETEAGCAAAGDRCDPGGGPDRPGEVAFNSENYNAISIT